MNTVDTEAPIVVAWQSFASSAGTAAKGQTFRATHPLVRENPTLFVPAGTPRAEWPSEFDHSIAEQERREREQQERKRREFERRAHANRVKLDVRRLQLTEDLVALLDGDPTLLEKGSIVVSGHPVAVEHPDKFKAVR